MFNIRVEDNNIVVPVHYGGKKDIVFPVELLEAVSALGANASNISDALMFHNITKNAPEWRWATASSLEGVDLTGWKFYYYESNWEDSCWESVRLPKEIRKVHMTGEPYYTSFGLDGERHSWNFYAEQELLLVKLTEEEFSARVAQEKERAIESALAEARWEAEENQRNSAQQDDGLADWERELLGGEFPA